MGRTGLVELRSFAECGWAETKIQYYHGPLSVSVWPISEGVLNNLLVIV